MKKADKTAITKERILSAAMEEFGTNGYDGTALNTICAEHGIAKGLIYHNFENKDDIYLRCVERALHGFLDYMQQREVNNDIQRYIALRCRFFSEHPLYNKIIFEAMLQPPQHLSSTIQVLKQSFDEYNQGVYLSVVRDMELRPGVTEQEAVTYFNIVQGMFNGYFSSSSYTGASFSDIVNDHETMLVKMLDLMLYGIVKEDGGK